jgi:hypothetical protein
MLKIESWSSWVKISQSQEAVYKNGKETMYIAYAHIWKVPNQLKDC